MTISNCKLSMQGLLTTYPYYCSELCIGKPKNVKEQHTVEYDFGLQVDTLK
jgi:hypothetical protein